MKNNIKAEIVAHSKRASPLNEDDFLYEVSTEELLKMRVRGQKNFISLNFYDKPLIYCWLLNNKLYFGQTSNLRVRLKNYISGIYVNTHYIARAINKYFKNKDSYFYIICICNTVEELDDKEKFFISKYKTTDRDKGYNLTEGGSRTKCSDETILKMIQSAKNKKKVYCKIIESGEIVEFESRRSCGRQLGLDIGTIYGSIKRKSLVNKKYYFSYTNDFKEHHDKPLHRSSDKLKGNRNGTKYHWVLYEKDNFILERDSLKKLYLDSGLNMKEYIFRDISCNRYFGEEFKNYKIIKYDKRK